jgi:hypothetical protein
VLITQNGSYPKLPKVAARNPEQALVGDAEVDILESTAVLTAVWALEQS